MYKSQTNNKHTNLLLLILVFIFIILLCASLLLFWFYYNNKISLQEGAQKRNEKIEISVDKSSQEPNEDSQEKKHELTIKSAEKVEEEEKAALPPLITEEKKEFLKLQAADGRLSMDEPYYLKDIMLINRRHRVNWNYKPPLAPNGLLQKEAWAAYEQMFEAAKKDNITFYVRSAYRSFANQFQLYNYYVQTDPGGIAKVDTYSAPPGASEHQSGLAIDLDNGNGLSEDFDQTPAGKWLHENAYKFGFIIRFPKDKQSITGYNYEPWHFRYIGVEHAAKFGPSNTLSLEEYLGALPAPAPVYNAKGEVLESIELEWEKERKDN